MRVPLSILYYIASTFIIKENVYFLHCNTGRENYLKYI